MTNVAVTNATWVLNMLSLFQTVLEKGVPFYVITHAVLLIAVIAWLIIDFKTWRSTATDDINPRDTGQ